ncbi:MAG: histidine--tRNA ligase, partial [Rhodobiaceae bacterium]|nr:histidine--tRNA ligase [Rhodobiaceae bacterium]
MSEQSPGQAPSKRQAKKQKKFKPKARTPRGLRDMAGDELRLQNHMIATIAQVYESYGFGELDTSAFEYADALGKFLPDDDRPNEGVFSLEDDDGQWMSLRYDLTAPLARYVAEHYDRLPKPLRRFQFGPVWRNEKPGPGRYRQFMQIDADTVGAANQAADAEICMMAADCMEALGLERGDYVVRINNRKIMDGLLVAIGLDPAAEDYEATRLTILRAMDKMDRLGLDAVKALLGDGRKDDSGDFTKGAKLTPEQIDKVAQMVAIDAKDRDHALDAMAELVGDTDLGQQGLAELRYMAELFTTLGYGEDRLAIDPSIVRGLGYYTGPVYEIELTFEAHEENGELARFGSVGGGGRYDDLVKRFKGIEIPATGISIGVSRLAAALTLLGKAGAGQPDDLIVVTVMDKETRPQLMALVRELRQQGLRAELYMGDS